MKSVDKLIEEIALGMLDRREMYQLSTFLDGVVYSANRLKREIKTLDTNNEVEVKSFIMDK